MHIVCFGDFELNLLTRQLTCTGTPVPLGARAFDLLAVLVKTPDRIISRDEAMLQVWPDTIVGENNLNVQIANLRRALRPEAIVTVPGRGFKFGLALRQPAPPAGAMPAPPIPDRPSIVVLPFSDLSGQHDIGWLADGCVEDITTELARFKDLFVVARNSAARFREVPRDLRDVARQLGVRYVVEGSVRAAGGRVRVTAQLIDALHGGQVWAEHFDTNLTDHFEVQHQIAHSLVTCLAPQIARVETERLRLSPPENVTAHGLARQAWAVVSAGDMDYDRAPREAGLAAAKQALALDPQSALAWRTIAWLNWWDAYHATTRSIPATLAQGMAAAEQALGIDPMDHHSRRLRAQLLFMSGKPDEGLSELRLARQINPNCAITLAWSGLYEATHGTTSDGLPLAKMALRLSPFDPSRGSMLAALGFVHFSARAYPEAVSCAQDALLEATNAATPLVLATIAYVGAGRVAEARQSFQRLNILAPKLVQARLSGVWLANNPDYITRATTYFRIAAGLETPA